MTIPAPEEESRRGLPSGTAHPGDGTPPGEPPAMQPPPNLPQTVMTAIYTLGYFTVIIGLLNGYFRLPDEHEGTMTAILGVLTMAQGQILSYWFGSGPKP